MKKHTIIIIILLFAILYIVACSSEETDSTSAQDNITPSQMQHDPMSFTGQISVVGTVSHNGRFNFAIYCEGETFELAIDYRGNQALPNAGTTIVVTGEMNYRPCCGPHILSTRFEVLEP